MEKFIMKPSLDLYPGVKVTKDTKLDYENENVIQHLENLVFTSKTTVKGEKYISVYDTTIELEDGDILVFEDEGRGYIKPLNEFVTIQEAIDDYENIKEV